LPQAQFSNSKRKKSNMVTYETITTITQSRPFLIAEAMVYLLPLIIYLLVGATIRGKTNSGKSLKKPMMFNANYWYAFIIWAFIQLFLFLVLINFPVWILLNS